MSISAMNMRERIAHAIDAALAETGLYHNPYVDRDGPSAYAYALADACILAIAADRKPEHEDE